jgi:Arc/MetJ family transcription regulator
MRTNIIIDDELMASAMAAGDFSTKKEAVEEGLKLLARQVAYQRIRALRGKINWSLGGDWTKPLASDEKSASKPQLKKRMPKAAATLA